MSYDPRLIQFTGTHEGLVLKAYRDPTGTITIGYGFTWGSEIFRTYWMKTRGHKLRLGDTITKAESAKLLKQLIDSEYAPTPLEMFKDRTPHAQAAGVDMSYNAGPGSLKWKWAAALQGGRVSEAATRYRTTAVTSRGRKLPGLVRRRHEMSLIMQYNTWPMWMLSTQPSVKDPVNAPWKLAQEDLRNAQGLLTEMGYGPLTTDGIDGPKTQAATLAFQRTHPQLNNDGVMGKATYSALLRAHNLKQSAAGAAAITAVPAAGGAVTNTEVSNGLLWGGILAAVVIGAYLIWTYRDEIKAMSRKL